MSKKKTKLVGRKNSRIPKITRCGEAIATLFFRVCQYPKIVSLSRRVTFYLSLTSWSGGGKADGSCGLVQSTWSMMQSCFCVSMLRCRRTQKEMLHLIDRWTTEISRNLEKNHLGFSRPILPDDQMLLRVLNKNLRIWRRKWCVQIHLCWGPGWLFKRMNPWAEGKCSLWKYLVNKLVLSRRDGNVEAKTIQIGPQSCNGNTGVPRTSTGSPWFFRKGME